MRLHIFWSLRFRFLQDGKVSNRHHQLEKLDRLNISQHHDLGATQEEDSLLRESRLCIWLRDSKVLMLAYVLLPCHWRYPASKFGRGEAQLILEQRQKFQGLAHGFCCDVYYSHRTCFDPSESRSRHWRGCLAEGNWGDGSWKDRACRGQEQSW